MADDTPKGDRIAKVLARAGVASRRDAEKLILAGMVKVNGKVISSPALNVQATDKIEYDGKEIGEPDAPRLWLYHKPTGLVTTTRDEKERETVFDTLPETMPRVMSVGRLDMNSEGLLLLTNDGGLKRQLELPSTGWTRRYRVRIKGYPQGDAFDPLTKGITVDGEYFQPMSVQMDRQTGANFWLTLGLKEGKNREIRRAMEYLGFAVNRLIRVSYGPFQLRDLKPGEVEEVKSRVLADQMGWSTKPKISPRKGRGKPNQRG
ncbi:MAG: pseudouridine synthase [Planktomarina sp.]